MHTETYSRNVAVGTFASRDKADAAISALYAAGFASADIGLVARRSDEWNDFDHPADDAVVSDEAENASAGAAAGVAAGAGVGGLWALGIAAGLLPAIGPVVAGGLLGSVLASAAAGAAAGGLGGALLGLGLTEEESDAYQSELASGRTLVTVRTGGRYEEASRILRDHGAIQTSFRSTAAAAVR